MKEFKSGLKQCKRCNTLKPRIFSHKFKNRTNNSAVYTNGQGRRWMGKVCPDCRNAQHIEWARGRGIRSIDDLNHHSHKLGRASEHCAREFFEQLGHTVTMTSMSGPDLICEMDGKKFTVEVKTIRENGTKKGFLVEPVMPNRRNDDFIAMVWDSKIILIEPMKEHIAKCAKSGVRGLKKEYRHILGRFQ